jgi:hypothetical protein
MARRKEPRIPDAILDQLLAGTEARTVFDQGGLLDELKKALTERALNAEMDHHLAEDGGVGNSRQQHRIAQCYELQQLGRGTDKCAIDVSIGSG